MMHEPCELFKLIPREKIDRIFSLSQTATAELDHTFLGFEEVYKAVTLFVPKGKVIIDLGCGYTFQSWYFRDYRKYIGVDCWGDYCADILKTLEIPRFDFYHTTIQRFIHEIFATLGYSVDEVFAVCSYAPDENAREMVRKFFPYCLVYYPTGEGDSMSETYEQLDIFSFIAPTKSFKAGEYIDKQFVGRQLTFDEITQRVGKLIVLDRSTQSHEWYMVALIEDIVIVEENQRRLIYYDGKKQRGLINEMYFDELYPYHPQKAFELTEGEL